MDGLGNITDWSRGLVSRSLLRRVALLFVDMSPSDWSAGRSLGIVFNVGKRGAFPRAGARSMWGVVLGRQVPVMRHSVRMLCRCGPMPLILHSVPPFRCVQL